MKRLIGLLLMMMFCLPLMAQVTGTDPQTRYYDTDLAVTAGGLWRIRFNAAVWTIEKNTAAAGNFSTVTTPLSVDANGVFTFLNNLLPATAGAGNLGSATKPFADIYFAGTSGTPATNNFKYTGASTTGTRVITVPDTSITINAAADISGATLASNIVTSSLTTVAALNAGSITSGFGAIDTGADNIITTGTMGVAGATIFTGSTGTFALDSATTNTILDVVRVDRTTTGTAGDGIGAGLVLYSEDASGNIEEAGRINASFPVATHATQTGMMEILPFGATTGQGLAITRSAAGDVKFGFGFIDPYQKAEIKGDTAFWGIRASTSDVGAKGGIFWSNEQVGGNAARIDAYREDINNAPHAIRFFTRNNASVVGERMRITSSGNIGILDSNPAGTLTVNGNIYSTTDNSGTIGASGANRFAGAYLGTTGVVSAGPVSGTSGTFSTTLAASGNLTGAGKTVSKSTDYTLGTNTADDLLGSEFICTGICILTTPTASCTVGQRWKATVDVGDHAITVARAGTNVFVDPTGDAYTQVALTGVQGTSAAFKCNETGKWTIAGATGTVTPSIP